MGYAGTVSRSELTPRQGTKSSLGSQVWAGALTGQVAGLIMAAVVMLVFTVFLGKGPLYPVQVIGSVLFGDSALSGIHIPALLAGLVLHQLGPSLFWGAVFGWAAHRVGPMRPRRAALIGAGIGLLSQIIDVNLVLPVVMNSLHGHDIWAEQVPAFWSWAAHLAFGLALGLYPAVRRRLR